MLRITKEHRMVDASPAFGKKFQVGGAFVYDFVAYGVDIETASGLVKRKDDK
jgi:hypothetical protein